MTGDAIRRAEPADVAEMFQMVRELAEYERLAHAVRGDEADLARALFPPDDQPRVWAWVLDHPHSGPGGTPVGLGGMAVCFANFSTWTGRHGIYVEDLYVRASLRGHGFGKLLLRTVAEQAVRSGFARVDWSVLTWNSPAIEFYDALGARPLANWQGYRLEGDALAALAAPSS